MNYNYIRAILNCQTTPADVAVYTFGAKTNNGSETSAATLLAGIHRPTEQARVQLFRAMNDVWPPHRGRHQPEECCHLKNATTCRQSNIELPDDVAIDSR